MSLKAKKNKDFSIIIPTVNRRDLLKLAITSVLRQKNVSLEVIVGDNGSTDDTEQVVRSFKDSRIRYIKNKKNIGYGLNVIQLFNKASGNYIFTLGDDDFILDENTLYECLKVMQKHKVGIAKIGTITYEKSPKFPYKVFSLSDNLIVLKPNKVKKIILKSSEFGLGFISGLIFDNSLIDKKRLIDHAYAYLPMSFDVILRHGIAYIPKYFLIAKLSTSAEHMAWYLNIDASGGYFIEDIFILLKGFVNESEYIEYKREFMRRDVFMLPSYKYFSSVKNYIKILKKSIKIDGTLIIYPKFIVLALLGFLPNFIIRFIRNLMIYYSNAKIRAMVSKYQYFKKVEKLGV